MDTTHDVAMLPGQPPIEDMTAPIPALLHSCYDESDFVATEGVLMPSLLQKPGHNQQTISRVVQERRPERFWPPTAILTKDLSFDDQVKRSRLKSITTNEARAWQNIFPGRHELMPETWTL